MAIVGVFPSFVQFPNHTHYGFHHPAVFLWESCTVEKKKKIERRGNEGGGGACIYGMSEQSLFIIIIGVLTFYRSFP